MYLRTCIYVPLDKHTYKPTYVPSDSLFIHLYTYTYIDTRAHTHMAPYAYGPRWNAESPSRIFPKGSMYLYSRYLSLKGVPI